MLLFAIIFLYYFIQNNEIPNAKNSFIFKPMRDHNWVEISQFIKRFGKAYVQSEIHNARPCFGEKCIRQLKNVFSS